FNFVADEEAIATLQNAGGAAKTLAGITYDSALLQALLGTTHWVDRVTSRLLALRRAVHLGSAQWKEAIVNAYARNVSAMCRFAGANGASFAAFYQPMLPYSAPLDGRQIASSDGDEMVRNLREQRDMTLQAVAAQFPASSDEPRCRFSDLSGILENR